MLVCNGIQNYTILKRVYLARMTYMILLLKNTLMKSCVTKRSDVTQVTILKMTFGWCFELNTTSTIQVFAEKIWITLTKRKIFMVIMLLDTSHITYIIIIAVISFKVWFLISKLVLNKTIFAKKKNQNKTHVDVLKTYIHFFLMY